MKRKYRIAVIIPTFNNSWLLWHTLHALTLQECPENYFEVIVADDGSSDNTKQVVESFGCHFPVKYLFQKDKGFRAASARNMAIGSSDSDICLFIDTGVLLGRQGIMAHVECHEENPGPIVALGYMFGYGVNADHITEQHFKELIDIRQPGDSIDRIKASGIGKDSRECHYTKYKDNLDDIPAPWIFCWSANLSVEYAILEKVGGFDEQYDGRWGCEDIDLGIRLQNAGLKFRICRKAESIHCPENENKFGKLQGGLINCTYLHGKFNTEATQIYLDYYLKEEDHDNNCQMTDINELLLMGYTRKTGNASTIINK